jgi:hypothetical protein
MGVGSMLAEMAIWARQNHPFGEIWMLPVADPAGVARRRITITIGVGILGSQGTVTVYIGGEKVSVGVGAADTNANVAANLVGGDQSRLLQVRPPAVVPGDRDGCEQRRHADRAQCRRARQQAVDPEGPGRRRRPAADLSDHCRRRPGTGTFRRWVRRLPRSAIRNSTSSARPMPTPPRST